MPSLQYVNMLTFIMIILIIINVNRKLALNINEC